MALRSTARPGGARRGESGLGGGSPGPGGLWRGLARRGEARRGAARLTKGGAQAPPFRLSTALERRNPPRGGFHRGESEEHSLAAGTRSQPPSIRRIPPAGYPPTQLAIPSRLRATMTRVNESTLTGEVGANYLAVWAEAARQGHGLNAQIVARDARAAQHGARPALRRLLRAAGTLAELVTGPACYPFTVALRLRPRAARSTRRARTVRAASAASPGRPARPADGGP
jgi:hypothetical protein